MDASGTQHCAEMGPAKPWASRGTWHSLDSTRTWVHAADSEREQGRSALPTMAACCSNGYLLPLYWQNKWPPIDRCLLPQKGLGGKQCEDPEASQQEPAAPVLKGRANTKSKGCPCHWRQGGHVAALGQSVQFSAQASTGGYTNSSKDFTSLTHGSFTCEPGILVPTSSSHGSFDV